jgi:tyrosyl-tRNA synthetase
VASASGNVIEVLRERGLVSQITESDLPAAAERGPLTIYCGFDATAPSQQIGNLVPVMVLAHFQRHGHRPILLAGGGTSMIGDPSGKSSERPLLTPEQVRANVARIPEQLGRYLSFEGPNAAILVNNADWLNQMTLIEYLRDIGKHFSVNVMLAKESVRARLEDRDQGISYTEFSYMVLQSIDYLHLFDTHGCTVQIGGHDQWGNLTAGVDLLRRVRETHAHALTVPLITSASGVKFGKSEGNALYLDPAMTSPYAMYQYWINIDDRDIAHYLRIFTFLPLEEISALEARHAADPAAREGQRRLAYEVVALIHGPETARAVEAASGVLFGGGVEGLTPDVLPHLASAAPTTRIAAAELAAGLPLLETLVTTGLARSKSLGRTLVAQGGLYVNDRRWADAEQPLTTADALFGRAILLRAGKRSYHLLLVAESPGE